MLDTGCRKRFVSRNAEASRNSGFSMRPLFLQFVERNLDRDTQLALVESYIGQVGNGNGSR